jgi:hypothetical protein
MAEFEFLIPEPITMARLITIASQSAVIQNNYINRLNIINMS